MQKKFLKYGVPLVALLSLGIDAYASDNPMDRLDTPLNDGDLEGGHGVVKQTKTRLFCCYRGVTLSQYQKLDNEFYELKHMVQHVDESKPLVTKSYVDRKVEGLDDRIGAVEVAAQETKDTVDEITLQLSALAEKTTVTENDLQRVIEPIKAQINRMIEEQSSHALDMSTVSGMHSSGLLASTPTSTIGASFDPSLSRTDLGNEQEKYKRLEEKLNKVVEFIKKRVLSGDSSSSIQGQIIELRKQLRDLRNRQS